MRRSRVDVKGIFIDLKDSLSFYVNQRTVLTLITTIAIVLFIRLFLFTWSYIPSSSMNPTLKEGDYVLADRTAYNIIIPFTNTSINIGSPKRGDVVGFSHEKILYCKRVLAVAGDTVEMIDNVFYINGKKNKLSKKTNTYVENKAFVNQKKYKYTAFTETNEDNISYDVVYASGFTKEYTSNLVMNSKKFTVPEGEFLMIGDNRNMSKDSRYIGTIKLENIGTKNKIVLINTTDVLDYLKGNIENISDIRFMVGI